MKASDPQSAAPAFHRGGTPQVTGPLEVTDWRRISV